MASELGLNLKMARLRAGLEQTAVAERLGTHRVQVSKWERGVNRPEPETLKKLAALYGVAVRALTGTGGSDRTQAAPPAGESRRDREVNLPRQLRMMALDFEREALQKGADEPFIRYVRTSFRDPDFVALFAGGPDESPMTEEEARDEMREHVRELRRMLKRRLERQGEESGVLTEDVDE